MRGKAAHMDPRDEDPAGFFVMDRWWAEDKPPARLAEDKPPARLAEDKPPARLAEDKPRHSAHRP